MINDNLFVFICCHSNISPMLCMHYVKVNDCNVRKKTEYGQN